MRKSFHVLGNLKKKEVVLSAIRPRSREYRAVLDVGTQPYEIQEGVAVVQSFIQGLIQTPCHSCHRKFDELDINVTVGGWKMISGIYKRHRNLRLCVRDCPKCRESTCLGCGKKYVEDTEKFNAHEIDWCCGDGRLATIWMILCGFDALFQESETQKTDKTNDLTVIRPTVVAGTQSNGTGYGQNYYGPGSDYGYSMWNSPGGTLDTPSVQLKQERTSHDQTAVWLLDLLTSILPFPDDGDLPMALPHMLELSMVIDKSAQLLRNDSLESIMPRSEIYHGILSLIEKLGLHFGLCQIVQGDRYAKSESPGLYAISYGHGPPSTRPITQNVLKMADQKHGKDQALVKGLENLALQSTVVLKSASTVDPNLREMCQRISNVYQNLVQYRDEEEVTDPAEHWKQFHKANALSFSDDILKDFRQDLLDQAEGIASRLRNGRTTDGARNKRILSECASMKTSLDEGTFVIVAESRPDLMKALIVGPGDTAYTHGLFEFDILLPEDYPRSPPKVYIHYPATVNTPEVNPNLHLSGLVCLSLLGTWHQGDAASRWQPGLSTVLQVLISIRAMVFAPNALHNEPMLEGRIQPAEVTRYNQHIQPLTVWAFMLTWLREERMRDGVWRDVVRMHFGLRGDECVRTAKAWDAANFGGLKRWRGRLDFRLGETRYANIGADARGSVDLVALLEDALRALKEGYAEGEFEAVVRSLSFK